MIGFFKDRNAVQIPVLLLLTLVLKGSYIAIPLPPAKINQSGLLQGWIDFAVSPVVNGSLAGLVTVIMLTISALYGNYVCSASRMFTKNNLLAAIGMLLFSSLFPGIHWLHPGIFMLPIAILLYQQLLRLYNTGQPRSILVNIGLIIGSAYLLYHPFGWMLCVGFFALATMRAFKITEWLLLLLSTFLPLYFALSFDYIFNAWMPNKYIPELSALKKLPLPSPLVFVTGTLAFLWVSFGLLNWQQHTRRMLIQTRKNWYVLLFMGLCMLPTLLWPFGNTTMGLTMLTFPAGIVAAQAFGNKQKDFWAASLFWLLVLVSLLGAWYITYGKA